MVKLKRGHRLRTPQLSRAPDRRRLPASWSGGRRTPHRAPARRGTSRRSAPREGAPRGLWRPLRGPLWVIAWPRQLREARGASRNSAVRHPISAGPACARSVKIAVSLACAVDTKLIDWSRALHPWPQSAERSHMEQAYAPNSSKFIDFDVDLGKRGNSKPSDGGRSTMKRMGLHG